MLKKSFKSVTIGSIQWHVINVCDVIKELRAKEERGLTTQRLKSNEQINTICNTTRTSKKIVRFMVCYLLIVSILWRFYLKFQ